MIFYILFYVIDFFISLNNKNFYYNRPNGFINFLLKLFPHVCAPTSKVSVKSFELYSFCTQRAIRRGEKL